MKGGFFSNRAKEAVFASLIILLVFLAILVGTGSLSSGYHLVDDHWVIRTRLNLDRNSSAAVIKAYILEDMAIRFRPLYQVMLVLKTKVLGVNMNLWMFLSMIEGIFTNIFLYFYGRNQGLSWIESFFAAGVMLYGTQFMPWYRALNQENTAVMFLASALLFLSAGFCRETNWDVKRWYRGLVICLILAASLMKESFCICIPAMLMYIFSQHVKKYGSMSLTRLLKKNLDYCIVLSAAFFCEIYLIVSRVGLLPIGYAGIDTNMNMCGYLQSIVGSFQNEMKLFAVLSVLSFTVLGADIIKKAHAGTISMLWRENGWSLLYGIYGIMSQMVLYARSGMWGRYILPFSILWGSAVLIPSLKQLHDSGFIKSEKAVCISAAAACTAVLAPGLCSAWDGALDWAESGEQANAFLNVSRNRILNEEKGDILLHINDGEFDDAVKIWLGYYIEDCRDRVFLYPQAGGNQDFRVILTSRYFYDHDTSLFEKAGRTRQEYQTVLIKDSFVVLYEKVH